ncbi:CAAX amino protease [Enterococcus saigonensis]|uniref:CAAX amino protease n=1 Tax=Enterococcus saigonensis TaxID=1805431 RepID=A0A679IT44_9ENTE|nr:type II CAAX endopeptidase family protein [Enterococcus saigonensis]BCA86737.1 CAAX amino protease [Enterococcus saigonensis]
MTQTNLLKRLIFYCGFILLQTLVSTVVFLPGISDGMLALISILVAGGFIYFLATRYQKQLVVYNPRKIGQKKITGKWKYVLLGVLAMFAANIILANFLPETTENQAGINQSFLVNPITLTVYGVILAPMIEELLFRGIFMNYFWNNDTTKDNLFAIITSALLFGLMHEPRLSMALVLYMTLGIVLASVYQKTQDLRCSMLVHMLYNGLGFVGMFLTLQ